MSQLYINYISQILFLFLDSNLAKKKSILLMFALLSCFVVVVMLLSRVWLFVTPWTTALQASLSFTVSLSLLKLIPIESVMPSNDLILCCPLLFLPSIFPSIRVFSSESALHIRWPKHWSFRFSISPSNKYSGMISFSWLVWSPCSPRDLQESSLAPQFKSINSSALSLL